MTDVTEDLTAIESALRALTIPGQTFEIRALHERKFKSMHGYFNDPELAADAVGLLSDDYQGIYFTPNPLKSDTLSRAANRFKQQVEGLGATDGDVTRRKWLLIDIDPIRPKGISSTNAEHALALKAARTIASTLELVYGWPDPFIASSGNGAHVVYPINLPNDDETRDAIKAFLHALKHLFLSTDYEVDTSVFNASRIWRLYGTVSRKGDSTDKRPHRTSAITVPGSRDQLVSIEDIKSFTSRNNANGAVTQLTATGVYERDYPKDEGVWRVINRAALDRVAEWVPSLFGDDARPYHQGYRISSAAVGRDLEEDITIHPWPRGIKDFGVADSGETAEGRRTPISLIAGQMFDGDKEQAAAWLSEQLGMTKSEFAKVAAKHANDAEKDEFDETFTKGKSAAKKFNYGGVRTAQNLMGQKFRDLNFLVEELLPEGAFFLSSRPKMRKSWLVLQLGIAVAAGGEFLGKKVAKGEVLALMLEDNDRRLKRRVDTLFTFQKVPDLSSFHYWAPGSVEFEETFPRGADGVAVIDSWLNEHPKCKLVIIDTFAHFRSHETGRSSNIYQMDYEEVMPLTRLAAKHQITLIIVHHERKSSIKETTDFIENTSGSTGLTGGVDGIMSIQGKRGASDENEVRQLAITGRDVVHDYLLNISFDAELGGWRLAKTQDVAESIIQMLRKYPVLKTTELYSLCPNIPQPRIRQALLDLRHSGQVENTTNGYRLPGV